MLGLWPVIALSGTLAGEAAKGSLDLLASTPPGRRTIAIQKLAGHITAVTPRDARSWRPRPVGRRAGSSLTCRATRSAFSAALGQVSLYGVMMLAVRRRRRSRPRRSSGGPRALAFGLIVLFASYLIYGYATLSPIIEALKPLSFFVWTAGHRPMAGRHATGRRSPALAAVDVVLLRHRRRRLRRGATSGGVANVGWLRLPSLPAGIAGPVHPAAGRPGRDRDRVGSRDRALWRCSSSRRPTRSATRSRSLPQIAAIIDGHLPGHRHQPAVGACSS